MASYAAKLATLNRAIELFLRSRHCSGCLRLLHASGPLCAKNSTEKTNQDDDFFGIYEEEAGANLSVKPTALSIEELEKKYSFRDKSRRSREFEQVLETSFGHVRLDHAQPTKRMDKLGLQMSSQFAQNIEWRRRGLENEVSEVSNRSKTRRMRTRRSRREDEASAQSVVPDSAVLSSAIGNVQHQSETLTRQARSDELKGEKHSGNIFDEQYFGIVAESDSVSQAAVHRNSAEEQHQDIGYLGSDSLRDRDIRKHDPSESSAHGTINDSRNSTTSNFIDEQYFNKILEKSAADETFPHVEKPHELNIFEEQYFGEKNSTSSDAVGVYHNAETVKSVSSSQAGFGVDSENIVSKSSGSAESGNVIEEQYFSRNSLQDASPQMDRGSTSTHTGTSSEPVFDAFVSDLLPRVASQQPRPLQERGLRSLPTELGDAGREQETSVLHPSGQPARADKVAYIPRITKPQQPSLAQEAPQETHGAMVEDTSDDLDTGTLGELTKRSRKESDRIKANTEKPQTAYDMAMKIRRELKEKRKEMTASADHEEDTEMKTRFQGPVDSKGFRILKDQVPDLSHLPSSMVVSLLKDSIIYNEGDLVAIDKPYGLSSHEGPGVRVSVGSLLPDLARLLDRGHPSPTLHLVHRLDKETTGVMVLARSEQAALQLTNMFKRQEIIRRYWVLTKGVPDPAEGVIDIPIYEGMVGGLHRRALLPDFNEETRLVMTRSQREAQSAVTRYRVLHSSSSAALVLVQPLTGIKHQLRVHLAFGLNTPILGDHKYSHFSRIAPQRLYGETLRRLGIRQSKVRHLPMHLHAHSLVVPEFLEGRNLFLTARLPRHFVSNMKRLKIKPPPGKHGF